MLAVVNDQADFVEGDLGESCLFFAK